MLSVPDFSLLSGKIFRYSDSAFMCHAQSMVVTFVGGRSWLPLCEHIQFSKSMKRFRFILTLNNIYETSEKFFYVSAIGPTFFEAKIEL
jgi:hypothetical protein